MSTSLGSNLPTRQQLEEIDALLKRMLSLPPLASAASESLDSPRSYGTATSQPAPLSSLIAPPAPVATPIAPSTYGASTRIEPVPPTYSEWTPPPTPAPSSATVTAWGVPAVAPTAPPSYLQQAQPIPQQAYTTSIPYNPSASIAAEPSLTTAQPPTSTMKPPKPVLLMPLYLLNRTFDVLTYLIPFGSWLRGSGRNMLGWMGIMMLLIAGCWGVGEWNGYDWPRVDLSQIDTANLDWKKVQWPK
jgi:hypothetical protein